MNEKIYLGDAVYAEFDKTISGDVMLTTENGYAVTNMIYLEPEVFAALHKFYERQQLITQSVEQSEEEG